MDILFWVIIALAFAVSFLALIYPIIPGLLFIIGGFVLYGLFFSFEPLSWWFWTVEILFVVLLFGADYLANLIGIKKFGGSKAAIWGSTIGLLVGPFIIPVAGILIGPFAGAVIGELLVQRTNPLAAFKAGVGSLIGFLSGALAKAVLQAIMVVFFLYIVL